MLINPTNDRIVFQVGNTVYKVPVGQVFLHPDAHVMHYAKLAGLVAVEQPAPEPEVEFTQPDPEDDEALKELLAGSNGELISVIIDAIHAGEPEGINARGFPVISYVRERYRADVSQIEVNDAYRMLKAVVDVSRI